MSTETASKSSLVYQEVVQSEADSREYRAFVLQNGLKVLLGSDPDVEKSAASMSVAVGSMSDPPDLPGLAHLCEHMLFIESNDNGSYSKFISENGGNVNAFTTRDQTNYHFDVASHAFLEAFTRFSRFFTTTPEFHENAFDREVNVINSEHENKLTNESWRKMAIEACTAKPNHPFAHFSTGNKETLSTIPNSLGINVLARLKEFHAKFYSPGIMAISIIARDSLSRLEDLVLHLFSGVENLKIDIPKWTENPLGPDELQKRIDVVPIADVRDLYLCFPIPDTRPVYKCFPHGYLSNLLGHKGPGSLYSVIAQKGWINNTYLNSSIPGRGFGYFTIGIQLTAQGLNFIDEITNYVFQYISMLKKFGPQRYFWDELRDILEIQFRFLDRENSIDFVQRVSNLLHVYPMSDVLTVGYLLSDYNEPVLNQFLNCFSPENCRVMTISKSNDAVATMTEKWYGVRYNISDIDQSLIKKWKSFESIQDEFHLPPVNLFIPSKFLINEPGPQSKNQPKKLFENDLGKAWFMQDAELHTPKAFIRLEFFSALPMMDPLTYNLNHVLSMMIKESFSEILYGPILAGLNYTIKGTMYGIEITVDGYDEKLGCLMDTIIQGLINFPILPHCYQCKKESYENGLLNLDNQQPYTQIPYYLSLLMRQQRFSNEELLESLSYMKLEMVEDYHKLFLSRAKLEWLIYGNILESDATKHIQNWHKMFKETGTLALIPCQSSRLREVELPQGSTYIYKSHLKNLNQSSCCAVFYQIGQRNLRDNVLLELLDQIIYEPCFHQLRNIEQLGYIIRTSVRKSNGTQGLMIIVQGILMSPKKVHGRIQHFLDNFGKENLIKMSTTDFNKHKSAVALKKKDSPKKLMIRANRLWNNEIYSREYEFRRTEKEIEFMKDLDKEQLLIFFNKYFGQERKCISVYLESYQDQNSNKAQKCKSHKIENDNTQKEIIIENVTMWKNAMKLSPLL